MKHLNWIPAVFLILGVACSAPSPTARAYAAGASIRADCTTVDTSTIDFEHQDLLRNECWTP